MNRKEFLQTLGLVGIGSIVPLPKAARVFADGGNNPLADCWLTPASTAGPFYFDPKLSRQDITEDTKTGAISKGTLLTLFVQVVDINCNPVPNVIVDIWHCDKDGVYSGYPGQLGGLDTTGQNFLRGTQMSDAKGEVMFKTIYPGWYPGRTTHIHFKARLSSMTYVTSQFAFDEKVSSDVYKTSLYSGHGQKDTSNASDGVFHNAAPQHLMVNPVLNDVMEGYDATYIIGINAPQGVNEDLALTGGQFTLSQNFPNPATDKTTIEFTLLRNSNVRLEIYDMMGRQIASLLGQNMVSGKHSVQWEIPRNIAKGNYLFQLSVENSTGLFRQSKVLTVE